MRAFAKLVAYASKASVGKWWKRQKGKNLKKGRVIKERGFRPKNPIGQGI